MIISQVNKDKEEFFINRYMELGKPMRSLVLLSLSTYFFFILDAKLRSAPEVFESSWKLDMLK